MTCHKKLSDDVWLDDFRKIYKKKIQRRERGKVDPKADETDGRPDRTQGSEASKEGGRARGRACTEMAGARIIISFFIAFISCLYNLSNWLSHFLTLSLSFRRLL